MHAAPARWQEVHAWLTPPLTADGLMLPILILKCCWCSRAAIPAFQPLFELPPGSWLAWVTKHLAHTPWEAWKQK